jgi:hypothetical protein
VNEESSHENKPVGDLAELIEWHTPELQRSYSPRHSAPRVVEDRDGPASDADADGAADGLDGALA